MQFSAILPIGRTLLGATPSSQSGPGSDGDEGVLLIPQNPSITGTSLSDCLVSYLGHLLRGRVLPLCRGAVSVFYSPTRLDNELCVCVCVCIYIYIYIYSYIYIYIYSSVCMCIPNCVHIHTPVCIYIYILLHIYLYTVLCIYIYIYIYIYTVVLIYTYIQLSVYM